MSTNTNTVEKTDIPQIIAYLLKRVKELEKEILLLKKRVLDLENP